MNFNLDDIRRAKEERNKEKGIVRKVSQEGLNTLRKQMSISSNVEDNIRSLTIRSIESVSEALEKNRKSKVELVFIFDKSASCRGTEHDTIMAFYDVLNSERTNDYNDLITTVLFGDKTEVIHDRKPLDKKKVKL